MEKVVKSHKTKGCRLMNPAKSNISPVIKRAEMIIINDFIIQYTNSMHKLPKARYPTDHKFMYNIIWPDLDWYSVFIRSCMAPVSPSIIKDKICKG